VVRICSFFPAQGKCGSLEKKYAIMVNISYQDCSGPERFPSGGSRHFQTSKLNTRFLPLYPQDIFQGIDPGDADFDRIARVDRKGRIGRQVNVKEAVKEQQVDPFGATADDQGRNHFTDLGLQVAQDPVSVPLLPDVVCSTQLLLNHTSECFAFVS
jgi:hypothetical protein